MKVQFTCKSFTIGIIYLLLLTIFCLGYLYDITTEFLQRKTTGSKRLKYVKDLDFPTLIICPMPGFKPAASSLTSYPQGRGWWMNESLTLANDTDLWELYKNLSYINGKDFKISFDNPIFPNANDYVLDEIASIQGMCYKITSSNARLTSLIAENDYINVEFLNEQVAPPILEMYLASNMSWLGVSNSYWPVFQPSTFTVRPMETIIVHLYQTDHTALSGYENVDDCLLKLIKGQNCSKICFPVIYNHLDIEPCKTIQESQCMLSLHYYKDYRKCYIPRFRISYEIRMQHIESDHTGKPNAKFTFLLALGSDYLTLHDEVHVMDFSQYIGSVGGTLGMFVGFSFFSYIQNVIELFTRS